MKRLISPTYNEKNNEINRFGWNTHLYREDPLYICTFIFIFSEEVGQTTDFDRAEEGISLIDDYISRRLAELPSIKLAHIAPIK